MSVFSTIATNTKQIFGEVKAPPGVEDYDAAVAGTGETGGIGLILFISRLIRLFTIVGGILVMINLLYAGWIYISSMGDSSAHEKAVNTMVYSVLGLAIIVGSYAVAALIGLIFFGDATFILNPKICGPDGC